MNNNEKKILIVEDNEDCRELEVLAVKWLGYTVIESSNGLAAIDQALATHPDLILMDISMPQMGGDEATARLKADPSTKDIPVIICTAFGTGPYLKQALDAGAAEILHKPFTVSDLGNLLLRYVPGETKTAAAGA